MTVPYDPRPEWAREDVLTAEHENALHFEVEPECPVCLEHGPTVRMTI